MIAVRRRQAVGPVPFWGRRRKGSPDPAGAPAPPPPAGPSAPLGTTRPMQAAPRINALEPEQISWLLGRWRFADDPDMETHWLRKFRPRTRLLLLSIVTALTFLLLAYLNGGLTSPVGTRTAIGLIINPSPRPARIGLGLLQDPVGLITLAVILLTPILFAEQVGAIQKFNRMSEANISYRASDLLCDKINHEVDLANGHFRRIGDLWPSAAILVLSAMLSGWFSYLFNMHGLYPSWNKTDLTVGTWRRRVYAGWWANPHSHLSLAIALFCLGLYFFYFVIKQVTMGAYFAIYIHRVSSPSRGFGVCPNLKANTDGFWGLRPMRFFMQATYSSALGHTIMVVGILVVWLPFNSFTVFMLTVLITINILVVVYPTMIGRSSAYGEKMRFVEKVLDGHEEPTAEEATVIARVWDTQNLPFKLRSALTAVTVYLLFPLLLAVASKLLGP